MDTFSTRLRYLVAGILVVGGLLFLPFLPHLIWLNPTAQAANTDNATKAGDPVTNDSPNVITNGLFNAADGLERTTNSTQRAINNSFRVVSSSIATAATTSTRFTVHTVSIGVDTVGWAVGSGATFVAHTTGGFFSFIANPASLSTIIRPTDETPVPVIEGGSASVVNAQTASSFTENAKQTPQPQSDPESSWPIHGVITTEFGVPHWPYQPVHTGLDISDGRPTGVTPIHAFKSGVVIEAAHSNVGFGNHVIVDHGAGVASLYGHLASISVKVGQKVDSSVILGYEGSTGASTGTHLHFEVRLNSQPVDPRRYVSGHP